MRLIDTDKLCARLSRNATPYFTVPDIENAPTVDAVVVTRCENCAFSQSNGWVCGGTALMPQHRTFPNSFCSDGERGEDA